MQIRRFYAKNVPAAMRDVRNLLGAEAVILSTRHLTTDDEAIVINGARAAVEVTAAVDYPDPGPAPAPAAPSGAERRTVSLRRPQPRPMPASASPTPAPTRPSATLRGVLAELKSLQSALDRVDRSVASARPPAGSASNPAAAPAGAFDHLVGQPRRSTLGRAAAGLLQSRLGADSVATLPGAARPWLGPLAAYAPRPETEAPRETPPESTAATLRHRPAPRQDAPPVAPAAQPANEPPARIAVPLADTALAGDLSLPAVRFRDHLLNQGVREPLARSIIGAMHFSAAPPSREDLRDTFRRFVDVVAAQLGGAPAQRDLPSVLPARARGSHGPRKVALVGPTGVGKTTTIAKIASHFALDRNRNVALVTLDTYRVGAVEQLRIYARLLGVRLEVVGDSAELASALDRLADTDLVLIDTPGHGPGDAPALGRLAATLGRQEDVEVMLVVAASLRREEMARVMRGFQPLGYDRLIFSKLDEAGRLGEVLNAWNECGLEVSYFTAGQRVPEDLEAASPEALCRRLLTKPV